jgi:hypothetical protein
VRLWTIHPAHLDRQGLLAVWREALLAQAVLLGRTKGYRKHPQLERFLAQEDPVACVATYLAGILAEANRRGYRFDASKIDPRRTVRTMAETDGQLRYEWRHLREKLRLRSPAALEAARDVGEPRAHPLFAIVPGDVRDWEKRPGALTLRPRGRRAGK